MFRRASAVAVVLAALALAFATHALAFASLPPGRSPHDGITRDAAEAAGFPEDAILALQRGVRAPDLEEMEWDPDTGHFTRIDASGPYRGPHHCDRVPPADHAESFAATVAFVRHAAAEAGNASAAGDAEGAVRWLGAALHAAQDCASHSNVVDLGDVAMAAFPDAVVGKAPMPAGLWLTGFEPGADDPERPPGDPYPHGEYAKDAAGGNAEADARLPDDRTKYQAARAVAVATSEALLRDWLAGRSEAELAALAEAEGGSALPRVGIPAAGPWLAAMACGVAAALLRRA